MVLREAGTPNQRARPLYTGARGSDLVQALRRITELTESLFVFSDNRSPRFLTRNRRRLFSCNGCWLGRLGGTLDRRLSSGPRKSCKATSNCSQKCGARCPTDGSNTSCVTKANTTKVKAEPSGSNKHRATSNWRRRGTNNCTGGKYCTKTWRSRGDHDFRAKTCSGWCTAAHEPKARCITKT